MDTKPMANNIGGVSRKLPLQMVVIQLNTFTAEGIAMRSVNKVNTEPANGFNPETNI